jgi:hypothetical protein
MWGTLPALIGGSALIDNTHTGGALYVRVPSCRGVFRAEDIRGTWNGFIVPTFTHGEAWAILTATGFTFGDEYQMNIWYTDATGEATYLTKTPDEFYIFDGWMWEAYTPETMEACS